MRSALRAGYDAVRRYAWKLEARSARARLRWRRLCCRCRLRRAKAYLQFDWSHDIVVNGRVTTTVKVRTRSASATAA